MCFKFHWLGTMLWHSIVKIATPSCRFPVRTIPLHTMATVMILSFRTQIRVYTVCHSVCIVWTHFSMVEPHSSNFRVFTTNVLGVRIFRKFTAFCMSLKTSAILFPGFYSFEATKYCFIPSDIYLSSPSDLQMLKHLSKHLIDYDENFNSWYFSDNWF